MKYEEIVSSRNLNKCFCELYELPIAVYNELYFPDRLNALDPVYNCVDKYECFCRMVSAFESEAELTEVLTANMVELIERLRLSLAPIRLTADKDIVYPPRPKIMFSLYTSDNDNKSFISIRLKEGWYSAYKHLLNKTAEKDWSNFVSDVIDKRLDIGCYSVSNVSRSLLYGSGYRFWTDLQQWQMQMVAKLLIHINQSLDINLYSYNDNEIIIELSNGCSYSRKALREVIASAPDGVGEYFEMVTFTLNKAKGMDVYLRYTKSQTTINSSFTYEFHKIGSEKEIANQLVLYLFSTPINNDDLVFEVNGRLARFEAPIDNPWDYR